MNIDDYQKAAAETAIYSDKIIYPTLGLCGEAGEVAEKVKKRLRDGEKPTFKDDIQKELGDVLWYLAAIATDLNLSLEQIAHINLQKLKSRQQRGTIQGSGDNR